MEYGCSSPNSRISSHFSYIFFLSWVFFSSFPHVPLSPQKTINKLEQIQRMDIEQVRGLETTGYALNDLTMFNLQKKQR